MSIEPRFVLDCPVSCLSLGRNKKLLRLVLSSHPDGLGEWCRRDRHLGNSPVPAGARSVPATQARAGVRRCRISTHVHLGKWSRVSQTHMNLQQPVRTSSRISGAVVRQLSCLHVVILPPPQEVAQKARDEGDDAVVCRWGKSLSRMFRDVPPSCLCHQVSPAASRSREKKASGRRLLGGPDMPCKTWLLCQVTGNIRNLGEGKSMLAPMSLERVNCKSEKTKRKRRRRTYDCRFSSRRLRDPSKAKPAQRFSERVPRASAASVRSERPPHPRAFACEAAEPKYLRSEAKPKSPSCR